MNWLNRTWRRLKWAVVGKPQRVPRVRAQKPPRDYPATLGGSARQILSLLQEGPMTRIELEMAMAPTTTARIHLPRLRERGLVSARDWPHVYSLTDLGAELLREMDKADEQQTMEHAR